MKNNKLRQLIDSGKPTVSTRLWSLSPLFAEAIGEIGLYDYVEFVAEYAPFNLAELDNFCIACELHDLSSMIKLDFQNRGYFAQKSIQSGFQSIMFTDCRNAEEVKETLEMITPETPEDGGTFGYANRRYIGFQPSIPQMAHAQRLRETVVSIMIEKAAAIDNIEQICSVKGIDMLQFGPSDYSMSRGWNRDEHLEELKAIERHMISVALAHSIRPRCEIKNPADAKYYADLGVKDFSMGDQMAMLIKSWTTEGKAVRDIIEGSVK